MVADPIEVALFVAEVLEQHGVRYLVGGSLASSISGEPRSTLDVDLVVELSDAQVAPIVTALEGDFYVDSEGIRRAIRDKSRSNLIHLATSIKVDLFIVGASPIDQEQMHRRQRIKVAIEPDRYLYTYTAEDILLQKLRWYRLGDEVSERQWRDVLGILMVQGDALDSTYLRQAAETLKVVDLLERAIREVKQRG